MTWIDCFNARTDPKEWIDCFNARTDPKEGTADGGGGVGAIAKGRRAQSDFSNIVEKKDGGRVRMDCHTATYGPLCISKSPSVQRKA